MASRASVRLAWFALVPLVAAAAAVVVLAQRGGRTSGPSIVVILADDQRWDTLAAMPNVQRLLVAHGVTFTNSFVTDPLCCPSRASLLTGEWPHSTRVYSNDPGIRYGGFPAFHDSSTIATWLHDGGYRTALIGKYLNGYMVPRNASYIPPGWDRWVTLQSQEYFDYPLDVDGKVRWYGSKPSDYSTDVLAGQAVSFIRDTSGPLFLYFAPTAPHRPSIPPPRYAHRFANLPPWHPPSYLERDRSDKPAFLRRATSTVRAEVRDVQAFRLDQYRAQLGIDDAVGRIVDALRATGRLSHTLIVYTSDNGILWGEHGLAGKRVPYEESIRVPMVVRYDPEVRAPGTDPRFVLNVDIAPTAAAAAGVDAPGAEGRSLLPLLAGRPVAWRHDFLVEYMRGLDDPVPSWCAVRGERWVFVEYGTRERELYDLRTDPYELVNRARDPADAGVVAAMRRRLLELCRPPPPGLRP